MKSNKIVTIIILAGVLVGLFFTCNTTTEGSPSVITVLHTNDLHSQVLPIAPNKGRWTGYGGFSKIYHVADSVRRTCGDVLLLSCGDFCQGTPFFNFFKGDVEVDFMNKAGYAATTLGNHEFDNGMESLARLIKSSQFPYVVSNYDFSSTPLAGLVKPYHLMTWKGVKVGLIGLTVDLSSLVAKENIEGLVYLPPVESAQRWTDTLRAKGADVVICLSHMGDKSSRYYVGDDSISVSTCGIDVILGGHTHTDDISTVKNAEGRDVVITQAGSQGRKVGQVDIYIEPSEK